MSEQMKMGQKQEQSWSTSINSSPSPKEEERAGVRYEQQDIFYDIHESLTGENCPVCGYPIVLEEGLEVCYKCGWYKGQEDNGTNI